MWISFKEKLPHPCREILVTHPDKPHQTIKTYSGTRPMDYREDGYSYWMEIPYAPYEAWRKATNENLGSDQALLRA